MELVGLYAQVRKAGTVGQFYRNLTGKVVEGQFKIAQTT
jgi:hypothetical protein